MAITDKGYRDCQGDSQTNSQQIYGLEPAEHQINSNMTLILP